MLFAPSTQNTKRLQDRTERIVALQRYSSEMDERNASTKMSALLTISFGTLPRALGEARHSGGKNCHRRARLVVNVCGWNSVQPAIRLPFDHDYYFGFSCGAGRRNHFDGDLRHTKKPSAWCGQHSRTGQLPCNPAHDRFTGMKNLRVPSRYRVGRFEKPLRSRPRTHYLVERLAGDAASPGKSCFKLAERIRLKSADQCSHINAHIKGPRLAIRQASP